jgi:oxaloacetate decarboxylase gamma subunit
MIEIPITYGGNMTILKMLEQSGILTLFGIGTVFGFLIIMVIVISWVGKMFHTEETVKIVENNAVPSNNAPITAAIAAAVSEYRKSH